MARRFPVALRRQGPKRHTIWTASANITAPAAALGPGILRLDQSFDRASLFSIGAIPSTIVRTRGEIWVSSDQDAANESSFGAFSMQVTSEAAVVAGAASMEGPIANEVSDVFFVHQFFIGANDGPSTGALFGRPWHRFAFDSKAQRKIVDGQAIAVMIENAAAAGSFIYILKFRMLLKLS